MHINTIIKLLGKLYPVNKYTMLEIIPSECGGFNLQPHFEYKSDLSLWEQSEEAGLMLFTTTYRTKYHAKTAAWYNGYEIHPA